MTSTLPATQKPHSLFPEFSDSLRDSRRSPESARCSTPG